MTVYQITCFQPDEWGHGGEKRSAQVREIFEKREYKVETKYYKDIISNQPLFKSLIKGIKFTVKYQINTKGFRNISHLGARIISTQNFLRSINRPSMIILENTHSAMTHFTAIASEMGIKTVVIPHNLESLVPRQVSRLTNKIAPFWLDEDIFLMKYASEIFTISREEQWLLKLFSIDAKYLPYKSTSNYDEYLTQIKKKREKSLKEHFLIMGSAGNTPTFQGMVKLIEYLNKLSNSKLKIYLIGFGTSSVQKMIHKKSGIINLGEITNDQLSDLLQKSKAVIINQNCSSGALTKIPELIRASVPIIINSGAARNFYNLKGLYIYNSLKELGKIIESFDTINESNGNSVYNEELIFEYCSACVNS